ncbi:DUF6894 family protein [Sphingomonas sp. BK069]|uniref:DUF6894 family protein n=1 Tax=Sphingomonas sp. BK069 TaxID=2586979 RepID=UPI0016072BC6|nr:hypothetical protein [Sphingomonas sp. BK069]MBB3348629.1 hypothetical protein [Sphingomonas sp. BK069]
MPRFRFTIRDDQGEVGSKVVDLPDISAAKAQAVEEASRTLAIVDGSFWADGHLQIDVTDGRGLSVATLMINGFEAPATGTSRGLK